MYDVVAISTTLMYAAITHVNQEELNLQMRTLVQDRTAILNVEFQVFNLHTLEYSPSSIFTATSSMLLSKFNVQLHDH